MIRIVGVQRSEIPEKEFVLLQNQGSMRISLRGHVVMSESALEEGDLNRTAHAFSDNELIQPSNYVLLITGEGASRWTKSKDGTLVYYAYMNRCLPMWDRCSSKLHILNTHHTFAERKSPALQLAD